MLSACSNFPDFMGILPCIMIMLNSKLLCVGTALGTDTLATHVPELA
jgi:hypothetical protein